ncbi:hypothetical protein D9757_012431 [Collybiopsis confluens]|uniref:Uncharacterized protein n=1 Tax=Collybiopsis confluens TaxID=2823264 RepID=A0A8H5CWT7_9AGAR|nr:hypothetical protein D9757_012431 [Collybiopsis confluens]
MTTDIFSTSYSARRKELLALVNQMRALGAQNDLDLPRITVIGNQSAGKSSVVEAISGITVPRDAGTCTRCPMECRLIASSSPWACRISVRAEFGRDGKRLEEVTEAPFGQPIDNKADVELALRKAQFAVLNPDIPFSEILRASAQDLKGMTTEKSMAFSRNVVCVDLEGPELTDLSFIDLPGLIQNAEPEVVRLVEEMVITHIKGNSLILVAVPMTDDLENQKALRLASQEDRDGRRTIGVLTKPDMLGHGSTKATAQWLDVIEDRAPRHFLRHGYYCTRQPDDDARSGGIEAKEARENEEHFFRTTSPWAKSTNPAKFGTRNLIATLSRLLVQVIDDNLPKIREDAAKQLLSCRQEISSIPPLITEEPATHLLSLLTSFCSEFQNLANGSADAAELIPAHRQSYGELKKAIRRTAPNFVPFAVNQKTALFNNCLRDEEDDPVANVPVNGRSSMNLTDVRKHIDQSITRELPSSVPFQAKASLIVQFQKEWPDIVETCFKDVESITLRVLLKMIELLTYSIVPRNFIKTLMEEHHRKCDQMLEATLAAERMPYTQNGHYLETTTQAWLDKYKVIRTGKVAPLSTNKDFGASAFATSSTQPPFPFFSSTAQAKTFANGKPSSPFGDVPKGGTQGTFNFAQQTTATTTRSQSTGPFSLSESDFNDLEGTKNPGTIDEKTLQEITSLLVKAGVPVSSLNPTDLVGKLAPPDEYETELRVCSEVRGYFQVAYKRMIDNIPRFIDLLFVRELARTLQPFLIAKFGLGTPSANERCASYLGEDPAVVARREELLARKKRLESVERELDEYSLRI